MRFVIVRGIAGRVFAAGLVMALAGVGGCGESGSSSSGGAFSVMVGMSPPMLPA